MRKTWIIPFIPSVLTSIWITASSVGAFVLHNAPHPFRGTVLLNAESSSPSDPIRLNKVFKATHSRREADALIAEGRVTVNGQPVISKGGMFVTPFVDEIKLDGQRVHGWETLNGLTRSSNDSDDTKSDKTVFEYIKYWKPRGVICTTDRRIAGNILDEITRKSGYRPQHRVFPVGRLDKDTSGLILLTSDGRLPNSFLRRKQKQPKVYNVIVDRPFTEDDLDQLRNGVVITTVAQRDRQRKPLTAKTKPCLVRHVNKTGVQMTLYEGRNRQIRKMIASLNYTVVKLHRVSFGGIHLPPLERPGDWKNLDGEEMEMVHNLLEESAQGGSDIITTDSYDEDE
eukprot:scaffold36018_cov191-Amphora_coffeaeformis.AAC.1